MNAVLALIGIGLQAATIALLVAWRTRPGQQPKEQNADAEIVEEQPPPGQSLKQRREWYASRGR